MSKYNEIGELINEDLQKQGKTIYWLSKVTGIENSIIYSSMKTKRGFTGARNLYLIAMALNLPISYLLNMPDDDKQLSLKLKALMNDLSRKNENLKEENEKLRTALGLIKEVKKLDTKGMMIEGYPFSVNEKK